MGLLRLAGLRGLRLGLLRLRLLGDDHRSLSAVEGAVHLEVGSAPSIEPAEMGLSLSGLEAERRVGQFQSRLDGSGLLGEDRLIEGVARSARTPRIVCALHNGQSGVEGKSGLTLVCEVVTAVLRLVTLDTDDGSNGSVGDGSHFGVPLSWPVEPHALAGTNTVGL